MQDTGTDIDYFQNDTGHEFFQIPLSQSTYEDWAICRDFR
jgi:hypothetical protein